VEEQGHFPLLQPMSELTGAVYARKSMDLLMNHAGVLGGRYQPDWPVGRGMVIGVGHIGANAMNVLLANRFNLVIVDKHPETLKARISRYVPPELLVKSSTQIVRFDESCPSESVSALRRFLPEMDIVICAAVRRPTLPKDVCEYLIRKSDVATMRRNSILCDATACDKEFIETAVSSESLHETYIQQGVIHYNCDHAPSLVARTATTLLTNATFPYVQILAEGFLSAVAQSTGLFKAVMCYRKAVTHEYSAQKKKLAYTPLNVLLG
jgi:alanine dehydrogenase